jgi:anaerobic selenocysteine-containing dehydrogenase
MRALGEVQLAEDDARAQGIREGDTVTVRSNGTSVELRARISRELRRGVVQIADVHAGDLQASVEVSK